MQLALKDVSFYYNDKAATVGPAEHTGIMEFTLPSQGVDIDLKLRMIPNTPDGLKLREEKKCFHQIERLEVHIAEDIELNIKQSNHPILLTVFKPIFVMRFRDTLEKTLKAQIKGALEYADAVAYDVSNRSLVFKDTGLGTGASFIAALWSELGHLQKMDGSSVMSGWKATGTGIIKDDPKDESVFAMGAEPQILSGDKRGPAGTFSEPIGDQVNGAAGDADLAGKAKNAKEGMNGVAHQGIEKVKEGVQKVKSFKDSVSAKVEEEKKSEGWESKAFDI